MALTSFKLLLISFLYTVLQSTSNPTYIYSFCANTTTFATNSRYHTNLNTLFRSLSSNVTSHPNGFYATSAASNTADAVYGLFLCRGDQKATACSDCVKTATTTDLPKTYCPNRKVAVIWYDECLLRYDNKPILGVMEEAPGVALINTQNITGNQTQFTDLLGDTVDDLASQTANGGSGKKYATKVVKYNSLSSLYAMEQCTPDLSPSDCNVCLRIAIGKLSVWLGARILQPSCYVRYETYPFYDDYIWSPPPSQSPSTAGNVTKLSLLNNCDYTVWPAISTSSGFEVPSGFALSKRESKIINIQPAWVGTVWGRTLCSFDTEKDNFSCLTGDCGNGMVECQGNPNKGTMTVANFRIGVFENQDTYNISVESGYNLPMMVAPHQGATGGNGPKCAKTGCVFKLNTCPTSISIPAETHGIIACENPCYATQQYCRNTTTNENKNQFITICQASDYCDSSHIFGNFCPRAVTGNSNESNNTFSCTRDNYGTSYDIIFCPSSDMTSVLSTPFQSLQKDMPPSGVNSKATKTKVFIAIGVLAAVLVVLISSCTYHFRKKAIKCFSLNVKNDDFTSAESLIFDLETLQAATNNFSDDGKLGGGGFGNVYKGTLSNGQEIAVKRLTRFSDHGLGAFKNEAILIAKLQHKNLVRLLGFCSAREERLLVYEFVPNKSLDYMLFDPRKQRELDWPTRYNIILGIARGLLYLHEDSRPRIIHRDLKAPNILLEADMNPKISDFGLARIFKFEQAENATSIIAGTYGYMAPEYAMHGQFSIKSDAYSFGVLLLEIVSGKKISSRFPQFGEGDLLTYAWRSWNDRKPFEILDPTLRESYSNEEVLRCIHLGLLCVQENSHQRPTMSTIIFMLNTESTTNTLPKPECPRSFYSSYTDSTSQATTSNTHSQDPTSKTHNTLTISDMDPR